MSETEKVAEAGMGESEENEALLRRGFVVVRIMGQGSYSTVKSCSVVGKEDDKVAIKVIDRRKASNRFLTLFLPRELRLHRQLEHPNIVRMMDTFTEGPRTYVVMELAGRGDLEQYVSSRGAIPDRGDPDDLSHSIFRQTLQAISFLHQGGIVHRDLKCENLFLHWNNVVKIGDFGFSREMGEDDLSLTFCGSRAYVAPEILQQCPYKGKPADCWSLGVILFIILEARMPFDDRNPPRMLRRQLDQRVPFNRSQPVARNLILGLLQPKIPERLTAIQALAHPWLVPASTPLPAPTQPASGPRVAIVADKPA